MRLNPQLILVALRSISLTKITQVINTQSLILVILAIIVYICVTCMCMCAHTCTRMCAIKEFEKTIGSLGSEADFQFVRTLFAGTMLGSALGSAPFFGDSSGFVVIS